MAAIKLSKAVIQELQTHSQKPLIRYDSEVPGLHIKAYPTGRKVFAIGYRTRTQRKATYTIGQYGPVTLAQARQIATLVLLEIAGGGDPAKERSTAKTAPTMSDLCDRYLAEHVQVHNKASTARDARRIVEKRIRPAFGKIKVAGLSRAEVKKWHQGMKAIPAEANRSLAYLSKMMSLASKDWALRDDNPVTGLTRYPENRRSRYLTVDEFSRLGSALIDAERAEVELPAVIAALRLLILTGCRHNEIKTLQWAHVDMDQACLRLPDSKTGAKVVHLGEPALKVLSDLSMVPGNPYVIAGKVAGRHFVNLQKAWDRLKAAAGLHDVRLHDLRHSYASIGVADGMGLPIIGKMLGHALASTTQKYAHVSTDPVKRATETVSKKIANALAGLV